MQHSPKSKAKRNQIPNIAFDFEAIGTLWHIESSDTLSGVSQQEILATIQRRIEIFDRAYSRFRNDSLVHKISQEAGVYTLPNDAQPMLDLYYDLYQTTKGAFTPLIGQTLSDAGYDASYSLQPGTLSKPPRWEEVLAYSFPNLEAKQPTLLDFGGLGKGYLVDILSKELTRFGLQNFAINAGGDIACKGNPPTRIGLEHPGDTAQAIGIASIQNKSICASSGNRRVWGALHHIIDPRSLASPSHIQASWVVADTTILADGLATCLFFTLPDTLKKHYTFEYAIVHEDYSLEHSKNFPAEFF